MSGGDATKIPFGPHDRLVTKTFTAFQMNAEAPRTFTNGDHIVKTGVSATGMDVQFRLTSGTIKYHVAKSVFDTHTISPLDERP